MREQVQRVLVTLLEEAVALCREQGIACCAADRLAWDAWQAGGWQDGNVRIGIMVPAAEVARLRQAVEEAARPNRAVELPEDNPTLPQGGLRYVATNTTLINLGEPLSAKPGVALEVKPLEETGDGYCLRFDAKTTYALAQSPLKASVPKAFCGVEVPVPHPERAPRFWGAVMGSKRLSRCTRPVVACGPGVLADACVPYEEFLRAAGRERVAALCQGNRELRRWRDAELRPAAQRVEASAPPMHAIAQRFRCCEKYLPLKDDLLKAWGRGRKDEVALALDDYLRQLKRLQRKGVTAYFDEELFNLAVEVLRWQGWPKAEDLHALVPERHREEPLASRLAPLVLRP